MPDEQMSPRQRALAAIDAATNNLRNPQAGSYEIAQINATIAVAEALLQVAQDIVNK